MNTKEISTLIASILDNAKPNSAVAQTSQYRVFVPYIERSAKDERKYIAEKVIEAPTEDRAYDNAIRQVHNSCMSARSRKDILSFEILYKDVDVKKITKH